MATHPVGILDGSKTTVIMLEVDMQKMAASATKLSCRHVKTPLTTENPLSTLDVDEHPMSGCDSIPSLVVMRLPSAYSWSPTSVKTVAL